jgi:hypothetical protein
MGNKSSSSLPSLRNSETEIVNLMMPIYYTNEKITSEENNSVNRSWNMILTDESTHYQTLKLEPSFKYSSCITLFYDSFYSRLFELHPSAKNLFKKGIKSQGNFLVRMISLSLSEINDSQKFNSTLVKLAEVHNDRGVKAIECT